MLCISIYLSIYNKKEKWFNLIGNENFPNYTCNHSQTLTFHYFNFIKNIYNLVILHIIINIDVKNIIKDNLLPVYMNKYKIT